MAKRFQVPHIDSSEITPESVYLKRREFMGMTGLTAYYGLLDIGEPKPGETVVLAASTGGDSSCE